MQNNVFKLNNIPIKYVYMYTQQNNALQINTILLKYCDKKCVITDATACIGGNSIFFCRDFSYIIAVEKDKVVLDTLKENLDNFTNKSIIHADYTVIMKQLKQDIIFIDPPWGGRGYKKFDTINLFLSCRNIYDIIEDLYDNAKIICLKVPINFNLKMSEKWEMQKYPIYKFSYVIFNIIIYHK